MEHYLRIKGKNKLINNYGWYKDFLDEIKDFNGKEIHYNELKVKKDFKNFEVCIFKDIVLSKDHELVQSILSIFKSDSFLKVNEKASEKVEYDDKGEPILDEEDWKDATNWVIMCGKDNIVYIMNKKANIAYSHPKFVKPFIKEELEERIFKLKDEG